MRRSRTVVVVLAVLIVVAVVLLSARWPSAPRGAPGTVATRSSVTATSGTPPALSPSPALSSSPPAGPPVAYYDPRDHRMLPGLGSPDRTPFSSPARPSGFTTPPPGSGLQRYLDQRLHWRACGDFDCATLTVPLDWDHPDGQAITLALTRARASGGTASGTLFINPGGPGASGTDFVRWFPVRAFPTLDVVGWDPRGSGRSTPVRCGSPAQTDAYFAVDASPDSAAEWQALRRSELTFARRCRQASGVLLDHVSTIDTARDLDYLRYLVGDQRLNYLGISYGTFIGAVYAELYPRRVGRMILDSAVNITDDRSIIQPMGFDLALNAFATWCADQPCGLGTSAPGVVATVTALFDRLDADPLGVGGRALTQTLAVSGVASFLYSGTADYGQLAKALTAALDGSGSALLAGADRLDGRRADGRYDPMTYAFPGIGCLDAGDDGWERDAASWSAAQKLAPVFGTYFGPPVSCDLWSARPADQLDIRAAGAPPIVVLGVTGDPATPYQQSVSMARQLESGVLVTWKGAGHSAFMLGNACVHQAVLGYVNEGRVPAGGTVC